MYRSIKTQYMKTGDADPFQVGITGFHKTPYS